MHIDTPQNGEAAAGQRSRLLQQNLSEAARSSGRAAASMAPPPRAAVRLAGLLLLALLLATGYRPAQAAGRTLMQSSTCSSAISKCHSGQCFALQPIGRLVCRRCSANYAPVVRAIQGAKYIVQCVCPPGQYHNGALGRCVACPLGSFCAGGEFIDSPNAKLGSARPCSSDGLVTTRTTGAQSASACVAPAGSFISSFTQLGGSAVATPCAAGTYAPANNRLSACVKCQAGLAEDPSDQLNTPGGPARDRVSIVCKVPPGKWYSQNVVKTCSAGLWRGGFVAFKNQSAALCSACPPGITTPSAGATSRANCSRVLPGYGLDVRSQAIIPGNASTFPLSAQDVASDPDGADVCGFGYYSAYNLCVPCPYGTTTRSNASASISQCAIPPGYAVVGGSMQRCGDGTYRAGWLSWNSTAACATCGANVNSTAVDNDEDPRNPGGVVRASPASCYIPAGWEITYSRATGAWSARACPPNTYGTSAPLYGLYSGLVQVPCKACPRGMTTLGASAVSSADECTNPAGYGYSSEGSTPCAPGFWAAQDSRLPCTQCPPGRTTVDDPTRQTSALACTVMPGFGLAADDAAAAGANTTLQALAPAAPCDVGFYQPTSNTLNATCLPCTTGSTTGAVGATSCGTCVQGYGRNASSGGACVACDYGSYARAGEDACTPCPMTDFYDVGGSLLYTSNSTTTFVGATGSEFCVPLASHVAQDAGQLVALPGSLTNYSTQPSLAACIASCPSTQGCLLTYTTGANQTNNCGVAALLPVPSSSLGPAAGRIQVRYKLPPGDRVAASSALVGGIKVATSQIYAACETPGATTAFADGSIGTNLDAAGTRVVAGPVFVAATLQQCRATCDVSALCWGFLWNGTHCSLRAGEDALRVVSFFVLPTAKGCADLDGCRTTPCAANAVCTDTCLGTASNRVCTCPSGQSYIDDVVGCQEVDACAAFPCHVSAASCSDIVGGPPDANGRTCSCPFSQSYIDDVVGCGTTIDFTKVTTDVEQPIGDYAGLRFSSSLLLARGGGDFNSKLELVAAFDPATAIKENAAAQFAALGSPDVTLTLTRVRVGCASSSGCSGLVLSLRGYDAAGDEVAVFPFEKLTDTPTDFRVGEAFAGVASVAFSVDACNDECVTRGVRVALEALDVSPDYITFNDVDKLDAPLDAYRGLLWSNVLVQAGDGKVFLTNAGYFFAAGKPAVFKPPPESKTTLSLLGLKAALYPSFDGTIKLRAYDANGIEVQSLTPKVTGELLALTLEKPIEGAAWVTLTYDGCDDACREQDRRVVLDDIAVSFVRIA